MSQRQDWTKWDFGSWLTSSISNREQQNSFKAPFHCAFCLFLALFVSVINPQYLLFSWYSCSLCIYNINLCIFTLFPSLSKSSVRYPLFTNPRYDTRKLLASLADFLQTNLENEEYLKTKWICLENQRTTHLHFRLFLNKFQSNK